MPYGSYGGGGRGSYGNGGGGGYGNGGGNGYGGVSSFIRSPFNSWLVLTFPLFNFVRDMEMVVATVVVMTKDMAVGVGVRVVMVIQSLVLIFMMSTGIRTFTIAYPNLRRISIMNIRM